MNELELNSAQNNQIGDIESAKKIRELELWLLGRSQEQRLTGNAGLAKQQERVSDEIMKIRVTEYPNLVTSI